MGLLDRLLTIVVTATLTSAAWIVAGSSVLGSEGSGAPEGEYEPPAAAQSPQSAPATSVAGQVTVPASAEPSRLLIPVAGIVPAKLSDTFSDARAAGARLHEALDIMAPAGTPVVAAATGKVEKLFSSAAGGNTIYVRSPDRRTIHYYAHLEGYAADLREGQQVRRGQRLGTVGSSGNANPGSPHLHFAILRTTPDAQWWEPATALNPYPLLIVAE